MGTLYYGTDSEPIEIPDRMLAHLRLVVITKLRRNERFTLSCPSAQGRGRTTLWLDAAIPVRFAFDSAGAEAQALDSELLRQLAQAANTTRGITVEREPVETRSMAAV